MSELFILIPGRTSQQGVSLNEGKRSDGYLHEINTLLMTSEDMNRLELEDGDTVRMWNEVGSVVVSCQCARLGELPAGVVFIAYGDRSSHLMGGETHGSGMPDSKGMDVFLEKVVDE